jgi:LmbE family N-acetylglucosaminyl deacetylase
MFSIAVVLLLLITGAGVSCLIARSPKKIDDSPRDVLIFAAHSDDCVIVGAEYACGAIAHGRSIRLAYLTCSGPNAEAEISKTRKREALAAWKALGVSADNLTFIDVSESAISGPICYSPEEIKMALRIFKSLILAMPKDAAVIIPASGESHVDHRTVRQLALEALRDSKRTDIIIYESPEYNDHLSLLHAPEWTMRVILRHIPGVNRFIAPYAGPAGYVEGSAGLTFRDPVRLAKKKELLMYFASQDGNILVGFFGNPTLYRVFDLSCVKARHKHKTSFRAFGHDCGLSALAWGFGTASFIFLMAYAIGDWASHLFSQPLAFNVPVGIIALLGGCAYIARAQLKRVSNETALFACAAGFGFAVAII